MTLHFSKFHGTGNDFILIDARDQSLPEPFSQFAKNICHRRFGIGADQVLILKNSNRADYRMEIFNADGSHVEMCGNGVRSFMHFLKRKDLLDTTRCEVETLAGIVVPEILGLDEDQGEVTVRVDMGEPILEGRDIPVTMAGQIIHHHLEVAPGEAYEVTCLSMGNPHCVMFVEHLDQQPVATVGPKIENHDFFPNRTNVEFVEIADRKHVIQRTWERGSGETYACGSGACAVGVACVLNGHTDRELKVSLKGGDLKILWSEENNHVFMTGSSSFVFDGEIGV